MFSNSRCSVFLILSALLFILPISAQAYTVHGELAVRAYGGTPYDEDITVSTPPTYSLEGESTVIGNTADPTFWDHDNYGKGEYYVELAAGSLGTYAYATTGTDVSYINSANAKSTASFEDTIHLEIPPGTYDNDLFAYAEGHLEGSLGYIHYDTNDPVPVVKQSWEFSIGGTLASDSYDSGGAAIDYPLSIDEDFYLMVLILKAGTYTETTYIDLRISASMMSQASVANHNINNELAKVDFYNTGRFTSFSVSEGVTWTSESGVFLSEALSSETKKFPEGVMILLLED